MRFAEGWEEGEDIVKAKLHMVASTLTPSK